MQMDDDDYKPNIIITRNDDSERESKKSLWEISSLSLHHHYAKNWITNLAYFMRV